MRASRCEISLVICGTLSDGSVNRDEIKSRERVSLPKLFQRQFFKTVQRIADDNLLTGEAQNCDEMTRLASVIQTHAGNRWEMEIVNARRDHHEICTESTPVDYAQQLPILRASSGSESRSRDFTFGRGPTEMAQKGCCRSRAARRFRTLQADAFGPAVFVFVPVRPQKNLLQIWNGHT